MNGVVFVAPTAIPELSVILLLVFGINILPTVAGGGGGLPDPRPGCDPNQLILPGRFHILWKLSQLSNASNARCGDL